MSFLAMATDRFDAVARFYGEDLGFPVLDAWDRPHARGRRFDLNGLRLEILDNARERTPAPLGAPGDRFHVVIEVDDVDAAWRRLPAGVRDGASAPRDASWGARLFQVRDPDGVPVTFLQSQSFQSEGGPS